MRLIGLSAKTDNILRDAAELRERAISKAARENNLAGADTLTRQEIDGMSHDELQRYFKTDSKGFKVQSAASEVKLARQAGQRLAGALAAGGLGTAMLAAGASSGSLALMLAGGLTVAATAGGSWLNLILSGVGDLTPCMFSSGSHLTKAEKLAQQTKDGIAAERFGSSPEAMEVREKDAHNRLDLLARARQVDPQATPHQLFDQEHTWLLTR